MSCSSSPSCSPGPLTSDTHPHAGRAAGTVHEHQPVMDWDSELLMSPGEKEAAGLAEPSRLQTPFKPAEPAGPPGQFIRKLAPSSEGNKIKPLYGNERAYQSHSIPI